MANFRQLTSAGTNLIRDASPQKRLAKESTQIWRDESNAD
jgi:hypothetical protein